MSPASYQATLPCDELARSPGAAPGKLSFGDSAALLAPCVWKGASPDTCSPPACLRNRAVCLREAKFGGRCRLRSCDARLFRPPLYWAELTVHGANCRYCPGCLFRVRELLSYLS